jgi:hypothetical protein
MREVTKISTPSLFPQRHLGCQAIVTTLSFIFSVVMSHLRSVKELIARQPIGISDESPTAACDLMNEKYGGRCLLEWNLSRSK